MNHTLRVLNRSGDTAVAWAIEDASSVAVAKTKFDELLGSGHLLFEVEAPGKTPEQVREFNPNAFEIVATRPFKGG